MIGNSVLDVDNSLLHTRNIFSIANLAERYLRLAESIQLTDIKSSSSARFLKKYGQCKHGQRPTDSNSD